MEQRAVNIPVSWAAGVGAILISAIVGMGVYIYSGSLNESRAADTEIRSDVRSLGEITDAMHAAVAVLTQMQADQRDDVDDNAGDIRENRDDIRQLERAIP
jgi:hypothetical protein